MSDGLNRQFLAAFSQRALPRRRIHEFPFQIATTNEHADFYNSKHTQTCTYVELSSVDVMTDGQSACPSRCRAPLRGPWPDFIFSFLLPENCFALRLGRPLWREDGSTIYSAVCQWSESRRTHNRTLPFHLGLLDSLSVASYDSQVYCRIILTRLHTGPWKTPRTYEAVGNSLCPFEVSKCMEQISTVGPPRPVTAITLSFTFLFLTLWGLLLGYDAVRSRRIYRFEWMYCLHLQGLRLFASSKTIVDHLVEIFAHTNDPESHAGGNVSSW
jgi:hypothetical protein